MTREEVALNLTLRYFQKSVQCHPSGVSSSYVDILNKIDSVGTLIDVYNKIYKDIEPLKPNENSK